MTAFTNEVLTALAAPLDPSRVAVLQDGPAKGTPYMIGHDIIEALNRIFGYGEWGFSAGTPWCIEQGPPKTDGKRSYELWGVLGKLTVRGGLGFSEVGTCVRNGDGHPGLDMAIKGAATDALKRCARNYGDQFGLVLYDKGTTGAALRAEYDEWSRAQRGETVDTASGEITPAPSAPNGVHPSEETAALGKWLKENGWTFNDEHVRDILKPGSNDVAGINAAIDRWRAGHPGTPEQQWAGLTKQIRDMRIELDKREPATAGVGW